MPSLLDAIESKYGSLHCCSNGRIASIEDTPIGIHVPRVGPRSLVPRLLILNDYGVDSGGNELDLAKTIAELIEIDLASNLLTQWNEVCKILTHTPKVTFLNLSFNELASPLGPCANNHFSFPLLPKLNTLILIGTKIQWSSIWYILSQAEGLSELHLSLNGFETVVGPEVGQGSDKAKSIESYRATRLSECSNDSGNYSGSSDDEDASTSITFPQLKKLMFDGNPISCWDEVGKLGHLFPSLHHLGLGNCPIENITESGCSRFGALQSLSLSNTLINDLTSISVLNGLGALNELKVQGIPVLNDLTAYERRYLLIALLPRVSKINGGGRITSLEREDAERAFIRRFSPENCNSEIERPQRYHELVGVHGELSPLADVSLSPVTEVKIRLYHDKTITEMDLNVYQTTAELKTLLEPVFGIQPSQMRLYYIDPELESVFGREEMRFPYKRLHSYNLCSGNEIHVEIK